MRLATCAGPLLLIDGAPNPALAAEDDPEASRDYRTAVGCDASGRTFWVVMLARGLDGRYARDAARNGRNPARGGCDAGAQSRRRFLVFVLVVRIRPAPERAVPAARPIHHCLRATPR